jgi:hypothetical protein
MKCQELKELELWEIPDDGKGIDFLKKSKNVDFWRNFNEKQKEFDEEQEELMEKEEKKKGHKTIQPIILVDNPEKIDEIQGKYLILHDIGFGPTMTFNNMNKAINLMAEKGWRCINISVVSGGSRGLVPYPTYDMYALMERL